jgi:hypothetical protein
MLSLVIFKLQMKGWNFINIYRYSRVLYNNYAYVHIMTVLSWLCQA